MNWTNDTDFCGNKNLEYFLANFAQSDNAQEYIVHGSRRAPFMQIRAMNSCWQRGVYCQNILNARQGTQFIIISNTDNRIYRTSQNVHEPKFSVFPLPR